MKSFCKAAMAIDFFQLTVHALTTSDISLDGQLQLKNQFMKRPGYQNQQQPVAMKSTESVCL